MSPDIESLAKRSLNHVQLVGNQISDAIDIELRKANYGLEHKEEILSCAEQMVAEYNSDPNPGIDLHESVSATLHPAVAYRTVHQAEARLAEIVQRSNPKEDAQVKNVTLKYVLIGIGVLLFLYFVWPTPYEYTRKYPNVIRVNRFTGVSERPTDGGWKSRKEIHREVQETEEETQAERDATYKLVEVLDYTIDPPRYDGDSYKIETRFKNGSTKILRLVSLKFKILNKNGEPVGSFNSKLWSNVSPGGISAPVTLISPDELTGEPFSVRVDGYEWMTFDP